MNIVKLEKARVMRIIKAALKEDIPFKDVTTDLVVSKTKSIRAIIVCNDEACMCGINIAEWVFNSVDYSVRFKPQVVDGDDIHPGQEIALVEGNARSILKAERTVLNFISVLTGIASETKKYVDPVKGFGVKVLDTRKTFPLLRYLEKYAVSVGGGFNHRMNLSEMVMIKDNHLKVMDQKMDLNALRGELPKDVKKIEVEVDNLTEFKTVLRKKPDIILLDNMSTEDIRKAVELRAGYPPGKKILLEASGGITFDNIKDYARTGVDCISIGALTDSVAGADFSLNIV